MTMSREPRRNRGADGTVHDLEEIGAESDHTDACHVHQHNVHACEKARDIVFGGARPSRVLSEHHPAQDGQRYVCKR